MLLVAVAVMVVVAMATTLMEEVATAATTVAMAAVPQATMAMVVMEAMLMVVSVFNVQCFVGCNALLAGKLPVAFSQKCLQPRCQYFVG